MIKITLDFETFWSQEFSLAKMPTAQYVNSPEFELQLCGIKINDNPTRVAVGKDIFEILATIKWDEVALIGHNLNFDGYILAALFGYYPKQYVDTASMARSALPFLKSHSLASVVEFFELGEKNRGALVNTKGKQLKDFTNEELNELIIYCAKDVDLTHAVYERLSACLDNVELSLMDITTRMMTQPQFDLDKNKLKEIIENKKLDRQKAILDSGLTLKQLRSTNCMVEALQALGVEPPTKVSPSDENKTIYTFQRDLPEVINLTQHKNPAVRNIINGRLEVMSSGEFNRAKRLLEVCEATNGKLPVPLLHSGAHTLRWSGADKLNLQNLGRGAPLRYALIAPPHHKIVVADQSQIEARLTAWLAEQLDLLSAFADPDRDVYKEMASVLFNKPIEDINFDERFIGKVLILSAGYGVGWKRLLHMFRTQAPHLKVTESQAAEMIETYRFKNSFIVDLWNRLTEFLRKMMSLGEGQEFVYKCLTFGYGYVKLPSGNCLFYPNMHYEEIEDDYGNLRLNIVYEHKGNTTKIYGGRFLENIIQALARCVIANNMLEVHKQYPIALMAHDEIAIVPHASKAEDALETMLTAMRRPPSWAPDLPLDAEGAIGNSYGECK